MPQANATFDVRTPGERTGIIDIKGEITAAAESALMDAYAQAIAKGARSIILNFAGLEYMNSSGIGLLVTLLVRANRQGQRLMATGLNEHYRHIFEVTRLDEAIRLYDTESQALAAANAA